VIYFKAESELLLLAYDKRYYRPYTRDLCVIGLPSRVPECEHYNMF